MNRNWLSMPPAKRRVIFYAINLCAFFEFGGMGMTIGQVDAVADLFTSALDADAQVILGARVSEDLVDTIRVVTLLAGIRPS